MSIATGEAQFARYTSCACPRTPKTKNMGFNTPFFKKQASAWIISWTTKKNKIIANERPWTSFHLLFFVTASFRLIPFYRIVWLVVLDLVLSRFLLWFIVDLAPALFRWPWHLFHPIHLLLVAYVLYRGFPLFFPSVLYINKNDDPSCQFTQLESSPMV
jgi:hypothetical protein